MPTEEDYTAQRDTMVREQLIARDVAAPRVLDAMRRVPRHLFVPERYRPDAYTDRPLPIGHNQTISQPYITAFMLETMQLSGHEIILEIGTGSGYQTALLAELGAQVYSIERQHVLARRAGKVLHELDYDNIEVYEGDGSQGLADMCPYDIIVVSAAVPSIPGTLLSQMRPGARLILPVGSRGRQYLERVWLVDGEYLQERLMRVQFMPLIGKYGFQERD
jgi:protein-L-isoaspartate(D-aspartate) O-methyltransferase